VSIAVLVLAIASSGCGDKDAEHFLEALKRGDYDGAHADLHTEARERTPNGAAIKASMNAAGIALQGYSWSCSSTGLSTKRVGYNPTTRGKGSPRPAVVVGVFPVRKGKCNTSLVVDLKKDDAAPGSPWRVVGAMLE
jgi:hypothetical protein